MWVCLLEVWAWLDFLDSFSFALGIVRIWPFERVCSLFNLSRAATCRHTQHVDSWGRQHGPKDGKISLSFISILCQVREISTTTDAMNVSPWARFESTTKLLENKKPCFRGPRDLNIRLMVWFDKYLNTVWDKTFFYKILGFSLMHLQVFCFTC